MIFQLDVQRIVSQALQTFKRFPLVMISAILATVLSIIFIDSFLTNNESSKSAIDLARWISTCYLGLPLLLAFALFCEKNELSPTQALIMQGGAIVILLGTRFLVLENPNLYTAVPQFMALTIFAHLAVAFAPYLGQKGEENGFWYYNQFLFFRFCLSVLYSMVLYSGIAIAIGAVQVLFSANIGYLIYLKILVIVNTLFNTWFFLSGVPDDFKILNEYTEYPQQLKVFTQFVLMPLVTLYLVILYAYEVKLAIEWHLPRGIASFLVLAFSIAGIFSLLLIHPIREKSGNQWIKIYAKFFFIALLPLLALLFISIGLRVSQYGITENRYVILMLAFWLLGTSIYGLITKNKSIKSIPISLAVVLLFAGFMPFLNAFDVSHWQQNRILEQLLVKNDIYKNGILTPKKTKDYNEIVSVLDYLHERGKIKEVEKYLGNKKNELLVFEIDEQKNPNKKAEMRAEVQKLSYERFQKLKESFAINGEDTKTSENIDYYSQIVRYNVPDYNNYLPLGNGYKYFFMGNISSPIEYDDKGKIKRHEEADSFVDLPNNQFKMKIQPLTYQTQIKFTIKGKGEDKKTFQVDFNMMDLVNKIHQKYGDNKENKDISPEDVLMDFENQEKTFGGRIILRNLSIVPVKNTENLRLESFNYYVLLK